MSVPNPQLAVARPSLALGGTTYNPSITSTYSVGRATIEGIGTEHSSARSPHQKTAFRKFSELGRSPPYPTEKSGIQVEPPTSVRSHTAAKSAAAVSRCLDALPAGLARYGHRLLKVTRAFIDSPFFDAAIDHQWSDAELYGLAPHAPIARLAEQGLVSGLALSALNSPKLVEVRGDRAIVRCGSGSALTVRRFDSGAGVAVPWWEIAELVQTVNQGTECHG